MMLKQLGAAAAVKQQLSFFFFFPLDCIVFGLNFGLVRRMMMIEYRTVSTEVFLLFRECNPFYGDYVRIPCTNFIWRRALQQTDHKAMCHFVVERENKKKTLAIAIALF